MLMAGFPIRDVTLSPSLLAQPLVTPDHQNPQALSHRAPKDHSSFTQGFTQLSKGRDQARFSNQGSDSCPRTGCLQRGCHRIHTEFTE